MSEKLLTISIPTYNRQKFLLKNLNSLDISLSKCSDYEKKKIGIYISDNSEKNDTKNINFKQFSNLDIDYHKNKTNIGSDKNIANCYSKPTSDYIMVLGDDDFVDENFFNSIIRVLNSKKFDVIYFNCYGFTFNSNEARNYRSFKNMIFDSPIDFLLKINIHLAFISTIIFKRSLASKSKIHEAVGTNLIQFNFALNNITKGNNFIFLRENLMGVTRNNTGGYDPVKIFCYNYFELIKKYNLINRVDLDRLKFRILISFYTRSFSKYIRNNNMALSDEQLNILDKYFNNFLSYRLFLRYMFCWNSNFSFYILNLVYIVSNIFYDSMKLHNYFYHIKNFLKKNL